MKQYDKIYLPDPSGIVNIMDRHRGRNVFIESASIKNAVIVLTVEELREFWDAAVLWGVTDARKGMPNLTSYLKSKGVTL